MYLKLFFDRPDKTVHDNDCYLFSIHEFKVNLQTSKENMASAKQPGLGPGRTEFAIVPRLLSKGRVLQWKLNQFMSFNKEPRTMVATEKQGSQRSRFRLLTNSRA